MLPYTDGQDVRRPKRYRDRIYCVHDGCSIAFLQLDVRYYRSSVSTVLSGVFSEYSKRT